MNRILEFDRMIRGIFSVFYRIILVSYGLIVLLRFQNYFQWFIYLGAILIYVLLVWLLLSKKPKLHKVRLLTDYGLITLILFDKQVDTLYCLIFLLLPVFNAPNFSGHRRSYWLLYGVPVTIFFVLTHKHFDAWILAPFVGLFWLSYFEYIRSRAFNFYYGLTNSISEFYDARTKPGNEYKIYNEVIKKFNGTKFSAICSIDNIFCLLVRGDKYFIQNGSSLFFDIEIINLPEFLKKVGQGDVFSNVSYKISGNEGPVFNLVVPIKRDDTYTVFFMSGKQKAHIINSTPYLRDKFFLTSFLKPFYRQLSELFASEYYFRRARIRKFEDISGEYEYVLRTINAVHFIRNRLTPFNNYLEMTTDLHKSTYTEEQRKQLMDIVISENDRSKSTLKEILSRARQILEEGDNPFNVTRDIAPVSLKVILMDMQKLLFEILGSVNVDSKLTPADFERQSLLSHKGIAIILADIIGNIKKHGTGFYKVSFYIQENKLMLKFINKFDPQLSKIQKLIDLERYFASGENYGIFKMSSKGAFLIKDFSRQMGIQINPIVSEEHHTFSIEFIINLI